jgi:hypothetical protein
VTRNGQVKLTMCLLFCRGFWGIVWKDRSVFSSVMDWVFIGVIDPGV